MEGKSEEWQMKEYSSSFEEENETRVRWILDKGMNIGKKIVITGIVISSTPFVLPPIIVISAIGFALSIPSGILLSSYLCTRKIMSMLLPIKTESDYIDSENIDGYLDKEGAEEDESLKRERVNQPLDNAIVTEDANLENISVEENKDDEKAEEIKESETEKKDDDVAREEAQAADTKGTVDGNNDEKEIAIDVVAEKTVVNGAETDKKLAKKKKGNKKNKAIAAHEESEKKKEEEKVAPQTTADAKDTSELPGSEKVPESKQTVATTTGGRA